MARYLVTGGCGFIGSHLADALLACGHSVRVLDDLSSGNLANLPDGAEFVEGDILDADLVYSCLADVDGCYHLAAIASVQGGEQSPGRAHRVNVEGAIAVFDAVARRAGDPASLPIVYASSAAVIGDTTILPTPETVVPQPISQYGADKLTMEAYAREVCDRFGVVSTGLRFFNVYGPRQCPRSPYSGVISIFIAKLLASAVVEIYGNGEQVRDFIYVSDAVAFLLAAMAAPPDGATILNGCTGRGTTINQLYQTLQVLIGTSLAVRYRPARAGDIRVSKGDPQAAAQAFSLCATTELRHGLALTLQHYGAAVRRDAAAKLALSD